MVNLDTWASVVASEFFTPDGPTINPAIQNWPFPAECPPKPWTPEQVEEYNKQQRDKTPEAPM